MKIASADRRSWLSVERLSDAEGYSAWVLEAACQTAHGDTFHGRNGDVQLLGLDRFVAALDAFVENRQTEVQIEGTYDSFIRISGAATGVVVTFRIGAADHLSKHHGISGAFELDQEQLLKVLAAFKEVASIDA